MILWGFVHHTQMFFFVEAYIPGMDEEVFLFTGRGREGQGQNLQGGEGQGRGAYCILADWDHLQQQRKS